MENKELLPCPFCGGESLKVEGKVKNVGGYWSGVPTRRLTVSVRCNKCKARGGVVGSKIAYTSEQKIKHPELKEEWELREQAKELWNTRTNTIPVGNGKDYTVVNE